MARKCDSLEHSICSELKVSFLDGCNLKPTRTIAHSEENA